MESNSTLDRPRGAAKRGMLAHFFAVLMAFAALFGASTPAHAVDGCKVLLCLAAPSWRSIPECVPTINQLHRDLARGKPFPVCSMAGAGNSANNTWASAPGY